MSVRVIVNNDRCSGEYQMYDVHSVDVGGDKDEAVLAGPLFLEVGEKLLLRIQLDDGEVEVNAKVHALRADDQEMTVRLLDLDKATKAKLATHK